MRKLVNDRIKTTDPIKSMDDIHALQRYLLNVAQTAPTRARQLIGYRNYLYFTLGINLGYRGGDLSRLTWDKLVIYNPTNDTYRVRKDEYNYIHAEKTGKATLVYINKYAEGFIDFYLRATGIKPLPNTPVFFSRKTSGTKDDAVSGHIDCDNMGRILKKAAKACNIPGQICTHTLRKTFGYLHYQENGDIIKLQQIFGHESPKITLTYIGITTNDIMDAYEAMPNTSIDDLETYMPEESCLSVNHVDNSAPMVNEEVCALSNVIPMSVIKPAHKRSSNFYSNDRYPNPKQRGDCYAPRSVKLAPQHHPDDVNQRPAQSTNIRHLPATGRPTMPQWQGACATD